MKLSKILRAVLPNPGTELRAGNVTFGNDNGTYWYSIPTDQWDQVAVTTDLVTAVCSLPPAEMLEATR